VRGLERPRMERPERDRAALRVLEHEIAREDMLDVGQELRGGAERRDGRPVLREDVVRHALASPASHSMLPIRPIGYVLSTEAPRLI
jgi:hypothetical protein